MGQKRRTRGWAVTGVVATVAMVLGAAGCRHSGGGDGGASKASSSASSGTAATGATSTDVAASPPALSTEEAYAEYQDTMGPGCDTVEDCQALMADRLHAVNDLQAAMKAADPTRYAEAIADVDKANRVAQQYGLDQLGAAGNMEAVMQPIQDAITWYASNR